MGSSHRQVATYRELQLVNGEWVRWQTVNAPPAASARDEAAAARPEPDDGMEWAGGGAARAEPEMDWTLSDAWPQELRLREVRNQLLKENLLNGKSVIYRSSGNSTAPRVRSNGRTTYDPVGTAESVNESDIFFFCSVQPGLRFYAHLVKR